MQRLIAFIILILISPLLLALFVIVKLTSRGPFVFKQRRAGKNRKPFTIYKIRTMVVDAENLIRQLEDKNEANGPAFKIYNDPRYTKFGRFLAHSGLDELLQLINIVKGEMVFVGPRPLPVKEASGIPNKYESRFSVLPGISSLWVVKGTDHSNFDRWMKLDMEYVKNKSVWYDFIITFKTIELLIKLMFKSLKVGRL